MTEKQKAKQLLKAHTLYEGDNGALKEYWTDKLEAKRHVLITIKEIQKYALTPTCDFLEKVKKELEKL